MSATMGTCAALTIAFSADVDSASGHETRTISAPASSSARTCAIVATVSDVTVFVMLCTEMGASPPISTVPTWILRDLRRAISRYGLILMSSPERLAGVSRSAAVYYGLWIERKGFRHFARAARGSHVLSIKFE